MRLDLKSNFSGRVLASLGHPRTRRLIDSPADQVHVCLKRLRAGSRAVSLNATIAIYLSLIASNSWAVPSSSDQKSQKLARIVFDSKIKNPDVNQQSSESFSSENSLLELEKLPVKGRAPKTGYARSAFGPSWSDVDRNGCDTRNDILKRDLTNIVFRERTRNCVVERGTLLDPFSNTIIEFQRGQRTSMEVQIDHVVSLSNAWQTGIFQSTPKLRMEFANDPLNLLAVKGSLNAQKGDGDAATWLPPNKVFRCLYVARQVAVKSKYSLWVTRAEKEAIARILTSDQCRSSG